MKFNAKRNYLHPVLRPHSDDYPEGALGTSLRVAIDKKEVNLEITFEVSEPSIQAHISGGNAICAAMLYCSTTLYREMLRAGTGSTTAETTICTDLLQGNVEVHPSIVALDDFAFQSSTVHEEYRSAPIAVARWSPLATDQTWHFSVNPSTRPAKGIFNRQIEETLPDGEFDINCDTTSRYVNIIANSATMTKLMAISGEERLTLPTVYTSALVSALAEIRNMEPEASKHEDGWVNCIQTRLKGLGINLGTEEQNDGSHTLFRAAQSLLGSPFGPYLDLNVDRISSEEEG